jgi:hypothetical protein
MLLDAIPKPAFQKHLVTTAGLIAFWAEIIHETASSTVTLLVNLACSNTTKPSGVVSEFYAQNIYHFSLSKFYQEEL